jgi:hypothetical protein
MILKPASFSHSGDKILFGSEDMHVYCVSPEGKLLWKSAKLEGLSMRDQGATIWQGLVIVRTNPADSFHTVLGRNGDVLKEIQLSLRKTSEDKGLLDKWNDLIMHPTARRREAEQNGIIEYLKKNRYDQCFYALRLDVEVLELTDGWPWAPFIVELGISGEEKHFQRTAQTILIASLALPHLSEPVRHRAVAWLDNLFALVPSFRRTDDWR